ncbi:hypothetical protein SETIT_1G316600v2 [Setaria italica]|uniref:Uncharacterized protein n=1 Tax=Setaria italica TaxID=4555 RepID=A0A368PRP9_SETIT|nr:hypothetical protein SETIT_1G316600v2 [Setaria italica]
MGAPVAAVGSGWARIHPPSPHTARRHARAPFSAIWTRMRRQLIRRCFSRRRRLLLPHPVPSRREGLSFNYSTAQSGGSHKSIKCMPCCKRYIGNAFSSFHTLTGQIAQRHDLLKCLVLVNCAKDLLILSKCLHSQNSTGNWFVKLLQC